MTEHDDDQAQADAREGAALARRLRDALDTGELEAEGEAGDTLRRLLDATADALDP